MVLAMLVLAAATAPQNVYRSADYRAYEGCLARTVREASSSATTPEDLLPLLYAACQDRRAGLMTMAARRLAPAAREDETARSALVTAWTSRLFVHAIRRYTIHYTTGLPLRI